MPRRRFLLRLLFAVLLGFAANTLIAVALAWSPQTPGPADGILFIADHGGQSVIVNVSRCEAFGRDSVSIRHKAQTFQGQLSPQDLRLRMEEISIVTNGSNAPVGSKNPLYDTRRYLPEWADWAIAISVADPERRAFAAGFPFRCLYGATSPSTSEHHGILAVDLSNPVRAIPVIPIPLNFAADSLVYSFPWLALWFALPPLRRSLRRRRGHCPRCNYDLRADLPSGCPECG
jgi:hypothetical protein